jgi:phospholipid-binding lipoprotein MlaA
MRQRPTPDRLTAYALVALAVCAVPAVARAAPPDDPWEIANRSFYVAHEALDHWIFGPAARAYKAVLPAQLRKGLRNVITNLKEPGIAANDLLQAHPKRSGQTVARFVINSTVGIGGLMDIAYNAGLVHHDNGFGTTAGRYGIQPGPYMFIPLFGPTSIRDLLGTIADTLTDPLGLQPFHDGQVIYARAVVDGLDQRAEADPQLKAIDDMSTDPYASLRSLYEQNRAAQIQDAIKGVSGSSQPQLDDFDVPPTNPAPAAQPAPTPEPAPAAKPQAVADPRIDAMMADMLARPLTVVVMNARSGVLRPVETAAAG